jgi:hypothetical protein
MGLMDRDYYREKREDSGPKRLVSWVRENPVTAVVLAVLLIGLILYLLG